MIPVRENSEVAIIYQIYCIAIHRDDDDDDDGGAASNREAVHSKASVSSRHASTLVG